MKMWEIWSEGFDVYPEHQHGNAMKVGIAEAATFLDACAKLAASDPKFARYYDPGRNTFWGCRLFDNEADARKEFG